MNSRLSVRLFSAIFLCFCAAMLIIVTGCQAPQPTGTPVAVSSPVNSGGSGGSGGAGGKDAPEIKMIKGTDELKKFMMEGRDGTVKYSDDAEDSQVMTIERKGSMVTCRFEQTLTVDEFCEKFDIAITPDSRLRGCESNLKNMGTALEMYSTDNNGKYPVSLAGITPNYLIKIPSCPSAQKDTYSGSYKCSSRYDSYTIMCKGHNHSDTETPENYPRYDSTQGLSEK